MILINTTTPALVDITALHSTEYLFKSTNLCSNVLTMSAEYNLAFDWKNFNQAANPFTALQNYMQNVVLNGPNLDPQTLTQQIDNTAGLPTDLLSPAISSISDSFQQLSTASQSRSFNFPLGTFLAALNFLMSRGSSNYSYATPCNYYKPIGDNVAQLSNSSQQDTKNTAPPWDSNNQAMPAPNNVAAVTKNKTTLMSQQLLAKSSAASKATYSTGTAPLMNSGRVSTEAGLLQQKKSMSFVPHGSYLTTDPYPYYQSQQNSSNILTNTRTAMKDCFRLYEHKFRYNPVDSRMNQASAANYTITQKSEGATYKLNAFGRSKYPVMKPAKLSIKEYLDHKDSIYDWNDGENRTLYPEAGMKNSSQQQLS